MATIENLNTRDIKLEGVSGDLKKGDKVKVTIEVVTGTVKDDAKHGDVKIRIDSVASAAVSKS